MKSVRNMLRHLFRPEVQPDPRLNAALDSVDVAAHNFSRAVEEAHSRGVFTELQQAVVRAADRDGERIRRARRWPR